VRVLSVSWYGGLQHHWEEEKAVMYKEGKEAEEEEREEREEEKGHTKLQDHLSCMLSLSRQNARTRASTLVGVPMMNG